MGDSRSYWEDRIKEEETEKQYSKEVLNFLDFFRLLSIEDKKILLDCGLFQGKDAKDNENEVFQSKKRRIGAGTGDDSSLFIASDSSGTLIWWRSNRGEEDIIFDGKELKTEEQFNQVFELLGIKEILKWT